MRFTVYILRKHLMSCSNYHHRPSQKAKVMSSKEVQRPVIPHLGLCLQKFCWKVPIGSGGTRCYIQHIQISNIMH